MNSEDRFNRLALALASRKGEVERLFRTKETERLVIVRTRGISRSCYVVNSKKKQLLILWSNKPKSWMAERVKAILDTEGTSEILLPLQPKT